MFFPTPNRSPHRWSGCENGITSPMSPYGNSLNFPTCIGVHGKKNSRARTKCSSRSNASPFCLNHTQEWLNLGKKIQRDNFGGDNWRERKGFPLRWGIQQVSSRILNFFKYINVCSERSVRGRQGCVSSFCLCFDCNTSEKKVHVCVYPLLLYYTLRCSSVLGRELRLWVKVFVL